MARYVAEGAQVTLVTCTLGEEGEVIIDELGHLAATHSDTLGDHRQVELANAMRELGVTDHRQLGAPGKYRDSGMVGTPSNDREDCFWRSDLLAAASDLVAVIREVRPQVLVTYDDFGGYGHPDHIQAHRVAMRASEVSEWKIQKIYWNTMPKSVLAESMAKMKELGSDFFGVESVDDLPFAKDDSLVTTLIDANAFVDAKLAAMKAHETQIALDGPFFALSNNLGQQVWGHEYYTLVKGTKSEPFDALGRESDLASGIAL